MANQAAEFLNIEDDFDEAVAAGNLTTAQAQEFVDRLDEALNIFSVSPGLTTVMRDAIGVAETMQRGLTQLFGDEAKGLIARLEGVKQSLKPMAKHVEPFMPKPPPEIREAGDNIAFFADYTK